MSKLLCPACHSPELATIDQAIAIQSVRYTRERDGSLSTDYPVCAKVNWDATETVGLNCEACGWVSTTKDWVGELLPACARCESAITDPGNAPTDGSALCVECGEDWNDA